jgi:hypothetical protein
VKKNIYISSIRNLVCLLTAALPIAVTANDNVIDDRSSGTLVSAVGTEWRFVADTVMGGVSSGSIDIDSHAGKKCLRLRGKVSTENNGGFVQMALPLSRNNIFDASAYDGIEFEVSGNNESYNIHLRTKGLWFPWQSYRASFIATPEWQTIRIPFSELEAYKTTQKFRKDELKRIGLVGIGRNFRADLCLGSIRFYGN